MTNYPLFYRFTLVASGRGFVAGVRIQGRVLARNEAEGWWFDAVEPGSMSEGGRTVHEALEAFREAMHGVLFDFAEQADSYENFKSMVDQFFNYVDTQDATLWDEARTAVRDGRQGDPAGADLKRETGDRPIEVQVERLNTAQHIAKPEHNRLDLLATAA